MAVIISPSPCLCKRNRGGKSMRCCRHFKLGLAYREGRSGAQVRISPCLSACLLTSEDTATAGSGTYNAKLGKCPRTVCLLPTQKDQVHSAEFAKSKRISEFQPELDFIRGIDRSKSHMLNWSWAAHCRSNHVFRAACPPDVFAGIFNRDREIISPGVVALFGARWASGNMVVPNHV